MADISTKLESSYRVVVVGAGMAGVSAANRLLASGNFDARDVCVLEAQERVGGRVKTCTFSDTLSMNVEVGAAWIHGTQGHPLADLARKCGIAFKEISPRNPWLHPNSCPNFLIFEGSRQLSDAEMKETWEWHALLMHKLQALAKSSGNTDKSLSSAAEALVASDPELGAAMATGGASARGRLDLCLRMIEMWMGLTDDALKLGSFVELDLNGDDPGPHCIVPSGMERFIDHLAGPVKDVIHTNMPVSSINYEDAASVVVECADGSRITTEHVVVTCSLGFLKSGKLHFQPELPVAKQGALERSQMGQYMKVLVQFPEVFWPAEATFMAQTKGTTSSVGDKEPRIYFPAIFNYYLAKGAPVLEGVLIGDKAGKVSDAYTDDEIVQAFFLQLQETFGHGIPEPVNHFITRWDKDEWAVGAYSCVTVDNSDDDPDLLRQTLNKRVLFAGEATDYKYQGALQAAYISGMEAAEEIVGSCRP